MIDLRDMARVRLPADPQARRVGMVVLVILVASVLVLKLQGVEKVGSGPFVVAAVFSAACLACACVYFSYLAVGTFRESRFPPANAKLVSPMYLVSGVPAIIVGALMAFSSLACLALAALAVTMFVL